VVNDTNGLRRNHFRINKLLRIIHLTWVSHLSSFLVKVSAAWNRTLCSRRSAILISSAAISLAAWACSASTEMEIHKSRVKGFVHPKMKILSVFTHPHVVPNLYVFICSAEHKGKYSEECLNFHWWGMRSVWLKHSSKYLPLCSAEQKFWLVLGELTL